MRERISAARALPELIRYKLGPPGGENEVPARPRIRSGITLIFRGVVETLIKYLRTVCLLLILLGGCVHAQTLVRVGLLLGASRLTVTSAGELVATGENHAVLGRWHGEVQVAATAAGLQLNHQVFPATSLLLTPSTGVFSLDGHPYRGGLQLHQSTPSTVDSINWVDLEDYVAGVVGGEIPSNWPAEALKAQAVACRSYALAKMTDTRTALYDVVSTDRDQVYEGLATASPHIEQAVQATRGQVLTFSGNVIKAYFSASCGGHTENSEVVFGEPATYMEGVSDPYCEESPYQHWDREYTVQQLQKALESLGLSTDLGQVLKVQARDTDDSGRVGSLAVVGEKGEQVIRGIDLRRVLGYRELRSTRFTVHVVKTITVTIETPLDTVGESLIPVTIDINLEETEPKFAGMHIDHPMVVMNEQGQLYHRKPLGLKALTSSYRKTPQTIQHGVVVMGMERKITLTRFVVRPAGKGQTRTTQKQLPVVFSFEGEGWGHGVGMCQWGSRGMALQGYDYQEILDHYYPGTTLAVPRKP